MRTLSIQNTIQTCKWSFISAFSIYMTVPLRFKLFSKDTCFVILVSLIAIISKNFSVQLKRRWKPSKFLIIEHAFIWTSDNDLLLQDI